MKIKLFQINLDRDAYGLAFMSHDWSERHGGPSEENYDLVFEGEVNAQDLEAIYTIFNTDLPEGYRGRSMSVSDIVQAEGLGTFFCDTYGFVEIAPFDGSLCALLKSNG